MYNLLVVDDESIIRRGIRELVDLKVWVSADALRRKMGKRRLRS